MVESKVVWYGLVFSEKKHVVQTNVLRKWSIKSNWNKNKYLFVLVWIAKCRRDFFIVGFEFQALVERANHLRRIPKHACVFQHEQILANADKTTYHQSTHGRFMIGFTTLSNQHVKQISQYGNPCHFLWLTFCNKSDLIHLRLEFWNPQITKIWTLTFGGIIAGSRCYIAICVICNCMWNTKSL